MLRVDRELIVLKTERNNELACEERNDSSESTHCFPDRALDTSCSSHTSFYMCRISESQNRYMTLKSVPCSSGDGQAIE